MTRHGLAQLGLGLLFLAGCSSAHSATDGGDDGVDAGARRDAGGGADDAGAPSDAGGGGTDAGEPSPCAAQRAAVASCPESLCDGPSSWHWNGDDCFVTDCGACVGEDCRTGWGSREACLSAHAACVPSICRESGGTWRFWGEDCEHFICGIAPPSICEVGMPVCDCGPLRVFDPVLGCVEDTRCTEEPPMRDPASACRGTGGTWGSFCCHSRCGEPCLAACAADACDCGNGRIFDDARGCVDSSICYERLRENQICEGGARCVDGLICCRMCGGPGCFGPARCRAPSCDDDPEIDECGNNLRGP